MNSIRRTWLGLAGCVVLFAALLLAVPAQAALRLQLDAEQLTELQRQHAAQLLDEVLAVLPPLMIERLDQTVTVAWSDRLPARVMGRASSATRITLNAQWLAALPATADVANLPGRQHPDLYTELKATLIHELAHLYDQGRVWTASQQRQYRQCRARQRVQGLVGLPAQCRGQSERRFTLSDAPRLLDLAGWQQQVGRRGLREPHNHQQLRSPDPYEAFSPQEFAAVNLEYFLLDPQYACRRPALAAYLREHFAWAPGHQQLCASSLPYLNANLEAQRSALDWLDPQRVYQIHYLLAEPDQSWAGRWGHSMLRLVVCAPGRPRGADCLHDLQHHMVLSYRAFVDDLQLSSWDGLTGVYPSRLFILPLQRVINEYTRTELRSLSSVPLHLDSQQVRDLVLHAVSQHWSYDGTYYFVSNNCAVETLKLLRSGSDHPALRDLDSQTPVGLLQLLQARNLADSGPLADRRAAMRQGYYFDSYRDRYEQMFALVRGQLGLSVSGFNDWLQLPAAQRRTQIHAADRPTTAALLLLEQAALRRHQQLIQHDLKQRYLAAPEASSPLTEAGQLMRDMLASGSFLSRPADLLNEGYGLPQPDDWQALSGAAEQRYTRLLTMSETLTQRLPELLDQAQRHELQSIQHNIQSLTEQLRRLHREAGGLVLP